MVKKLLEYSTSISDHIEGFRKHYEIATTAEAIRTLILDGFKFHGNPLDESPKLIVGRGRPVPTPEEKRITYEELMSKLGLSVNEEN